MGPSHRSRGPFDAARRATANSCFPPAQSIPGDSRLSRTQRITADPNNGRRGGGAPGVDRGAAWSAGARARPPRARRVARAAAHRWRRAPCPRPAPRWAPQRGTRRAAEHGCPGAGGLGCRGAGVPGAEAVPAHRGAPERPRAAVWRRPVAAAPAGGPRTRRDAPQPATNCGAAPATAAAGRRAGGRGGACSSLPASSKQDWPPVR
jgi:hypothetical protein